MSLFDVLIIGGGPSGLSAALTLVRQNHSVVLFDHGHYRALPSLHIHGVSGAENQPPAGYLAALRSELEPYKTYESRQAEIKNLKATEGGFEATDINGTTYQGKKVILANGVENIFPEIDGFKDVWGKGMFHNLFAQAYQQEPSKAHCGVLAVGLIAMPQFTYHLAHLSYQLAHNVTIYTNGNENLVQQMSSTLENKPWKTDSRKISKLALKNPGGSGTGVVITFADGSTAEMFMSHAPMTTVSGPFAEQLGINVGPSGGEYDINGPFQATNVRGVYAAGDNMTMFKAWANAIASGAQAAAGVAIALQEEKWGLPHVFG